MIKKTPTWLIRLFFFQYATNINEGFLASVIISPQHFDHCDDEYRCR